jgi:hypothetical protein
MWIAEFSMASTSHAHHAQAKIGIALMITSKQKAMAVQSAISAVPVVALTG